MKSTALLFLLLVTTLVSAGESWPSWRGDLLGSGKTDETKLPTEWSAEKNVRWRVELPEAGNSTPVVHGDRIFVTQPVTATHWRGLMCFDRNSGKLLWKNGLVYDKTEPTHRSNPYCSPSPATDGKIVVAAYGDAGIAAYDFEGKQLWHRDFGPNEHTWGKSTSPVLYGDLCIYYHGPGKGSFLTALNKTTGETVWTWKEAEWKPGTRTDGFQGQGEGIIGSFSTPIIVETEKRVELIMSFPMEMKSFDPLTGKILWSCSGLNPLVYTSPVYADGIVVSLGGYHGNSIGVKVGGSGDVTDTHRLWQEVRHNGGIGTGVIKDGLYYYHDSGGIMCCLDIKTGVTRWKDRLPGAGKSWGSFVLAGDRVYTLSQAGDTVVLKANPDKMEVLAQSQVGEQTNSSLVPVQGEFILRTHKALWCLGGK